MKPYKFPEACIGGLRSECGTKVKRDGDLAVILLKGGQPHVRISVDIVASVGVTVQVLHNNTWQPFYESKWTPEQAQDHVAKNYTPFFYPEFPATFAELNEEQRATVLYDENDGMIDFLMDQVSAIVASALFSEEPTMEINVDGYPEVMNRAMLEAFNIDTRDADDQLAGLVDCHGNRKRKKKKAK